MKKVLFIVSLLLFMSFSASAAFAEYGEGTWKSLDEMNEKRFGFDAAMFNENIYVFGGQTDSGKSNSVEMYNPINDTWTEAFELPYPYVGRGAATVNDAVYLFGPRETIYFNPETCTTLNSDDCYNYAEAMKYEGQETTTRADDKFKGKYATTVLGDYIYIIGGTYGGENGEPTKEVLTFNTTDGTWSESTEQSQLNVERNGAKAVTVDGKIYVMGGWDHPYVGTSKSASQKTYLDTVEMYDPAQNTWTVIGNMPNPKANFAATVIDGSIYIIGGTGANDHGYIDIFDTKSQTWDSVKINSDVYKKNKSQLASISIDGGFILIGGKYATKDHSATTEMYFPEIIPTTTFDIHFVSGLSQQYELTQSKINNFMDWYESADGKNGTSSDYYILTKDNKTHYIPHALIEMFSYPAIEDPDDGIPEFAKEDGLQIMLQSGMEKTYDMNTDSFKSWYHMPDSPFYGIQDEDENRMNYFIHDKIELFITD
ncbi:Kelch repeat-containing protein [Longirhabdus pacifica]|uniref:Kelch repeat-containing protein n=1 Tax=Longirhabdus pacifica TaxID=2305227 RepID=UPI001009166F|nr:kelch repeat-containing protein [Longirhabdus pacifica]